MRFPSGIFMRSLALAVLKVPGLDEVDTSASPFLGERVRVIHVHVDERATDPIGTDAGSGEMDRRLVAMSKRIPRVMMRRTEASLIALTSLAGERAATTTRCSSSSSASTEPAY